MDRTPAAALETPVTVAPDSIASPARPARVQSATDWLISIGPKLAQFKAQDRAELVSLMRKGDATDAALMTRLAWNRYLFPECREHWRRAFVGLTLEEAWGGGRIDMGPDEKRWAETHQGCSNSWSGD